MATVILVRTDSASPTAPILSWSDPPLPRSGLDQARESGVLLKTLGQDVSLAIASPFRRDVQFLNETLRSSEQDSAPVQKVMGLASRFAGNLEGQARDSAKLGPAAPPELDASDARHPKNSRLHLRFNSDASAIRTSESEADFSARVRSAVTPHLQQKSGALLVAADEAVLAVIITSVLGLELPPFIPPSRPLVSKKGDSAWTLEVLGKSVSPHISDLLAAKAPDALSWSYEYFPPKTDQGVANMVKRMAKMQKDKPVFMDVTWGAGGSTSTRTLEMMAHIQDLPDPVGNMHITCTNLPAGLVDDGLNAASALGIRNLVALRGDPPEGKEWVANPDGFTCALDLVRHIRRDYGNTFCLCVAGYPEGHPSVIRSYPGRVTPEDYKKEMAYLKAKIDAGSQVIITQLFYDPQIFLDFVKDCRDIGINVPILPGILPFSSYESFQKIASLCKTYIPDELQKRIDAIKDDKEKVCQLGIDWCIEMCQKLKAAGIRHFHMYTMNSEVASWQILKALGCSVGE